MDHVGQGLATEATAALTRLAMERHGVHRIQLLVDPENLASAAIPRKLGYCLEATLRDRFKLPTGELRDSAIWSLFAEDYPSSPSARAALRAFGAGGDTTHYSASPSSPSSTAGG